MSRRNRRGRAVHGILLLDKPCGGSSNHALQRIKRLFDAKKAGHTGSLDPLATGMLPICFGEATKLSAYLLNADKGYETTLQLGVTTNSADSDGEVLETRPVPEDLTMASFVRICDRFKGPQQQIPPMVSAIKIDGQRLYKLARQGIEVERPARAVVIHHLEVLAFSGTTARLAVHCSKGTYIRSLVTDIGEALGCGAHVAALRRTFVSPFQDLPMVTIDHLEGAPGAIDDLLLPLDAGLGHLAAVQVEAAALQAIQQGQTTLCRLIDQGQTEPDIDNSDDAAHCRIYDPQGRLLGLGQLADSGEHVAPKRVLQWA